MSETSAVKVVPSKLVDNALKSNANLTDSAQKRLSRNVARQSRRNEVKPSPDDVDENTWEGVRAAAMTLVREESLRSAKQNNDASWDEDDDEEIEHDEEDDDCLNNNAQRKRDRDESNFEHEPPRDPHLAYLLPKKAGQVLPAQEESRDHNFND